eukprot:XP_001697154.1 predicted protein [Chlamydomonas reinhardtii]
MEGGRAASGLLVLPRGPGGPLVDTAAVRELLSTIAQGGYSAQLAAATQLSEQLETEEGRFRDVERESVYDTVCDSWILSRTAALEQQVAGLRLVLACLSAWSFQYPLTEDRCMELLLEWAGEGGDDTPTPSDPAPADEEALLKEARSVYATGVAAAGPAAAGVVVVGPPDYRLLYDALGACVALTAHRRFSEQLVEAGGVELLLALPRWGGGGGIGAEGGGHAPPTYAWSGSREALDAIGALVESDRRLAEAFCRCRWPALEALLDAGCPALLLGLVADLPPERWFHEAAQPSEPPPLDLGPAAPTLGSALEAGYVAARQAVRAANGIRSLMQLLQPKHAGTPPFARSSRGFSWRVCCQTWLPRASDTWGTAPAVRHGDKLTAAANDAAAPALHKIERAAIAAASAVSYSPQELLLLIFEHLKASGLHAAASALAAEAGLGRASAALQRLLYLQPPQLVVAGAAAGGAGGAGGALPAPGNVGAARKGEGPDTDGLVRKARGGKGQQQPQHQGQKQQAPKTAAAFVLAANGNGGGGGGAGAGSDSEYLARAFGASVHRTGAGHAGASPQHRQAVMSSAVPTACLPAIPLAKPYVMPQLIYSRFRPLRTFRDDGALTLCAAFVQGWRRLLVGTSGGDLRLHDPLEGAEALDLLPEAHDSAVATWTGVTKARFHPDGTQVVAVSATSPRQALLFDLLLWGNALYDLRAAAPVHQFDQFTDGGAGAFHPAGLEVILNSEVWDLRTFRLLRSVPSLDGASVLFNGGGDVLYAARRQSDEPFSALFHPRRARHPLHTAFRSLDAGAYTDIATVPLERVVLDMAVEPSDSLLAVVCVDLAEEQLTSAARVFERFTGESVSAEVSRLELE